MAMSLAAVLACSLPVGRLENTDLHLEPCLLLASSIEARLVCPSSNAVVLHARIPKIVHVDRPLEIELNAVDADTCTAEVAALAHSLSTDALLLIATTENADLSISLPVAVRTSGGGLILRALVQHERWATAASVTVLSLSLDRKPLLDCTPATLRVGYNHSPAPASAGAVLAAAQAGDVPALQAALDDGGSTEETDAVREDR